MVFIGSMVRPAIWQIRPDFKTLRLLPRIVGIFRGGDDHLLKGVAAIFEEHGFRLVGAHEIAPEILMPEGPSGASVPASATVPTSQRGSPCSMRPVRSTSAKRWSWPMRVCSQSRPRKAPIACSRASRNFVRAGASRMASGRGVLVKAAKRGQDRRVDLPSIGPQTVEGAARAGLAGIAVVAGSTIVAEPERISATADRERLFVLGVRDETADQ